MNIFDDFKKTCPNWGHVNFVDRHHEAVIKDYVFYLESKIRANKKREQQVQELAKTVRQLMPSYLYSDGDDYIGEYKCPICFKVIHEKNVKDSLDIMEQIDHTTNCAYLIAKDLLDE